MPGQISTSQKILNTTGHQCLLSIGHSIFVSKVRKYRKEAEKEYDHTHDVPFSLLVEKDAVARILISDAVARAIDECIEENVLKEFFLAHRKEVIEMSILEYTAEDHIKELQDESYEIGFGKGYDSGYDNGYGSGYDNGYGSGYDTGIDDVTSLLLWLKENNRINEITNINDKSLLSKLFKEYQNNK